MVSSVVKKPWDKWSMAQLRSAVVARDITPEVACILVHIWRVARQSGRKAVIDCDCAVDRQGLSAREVAYAYRAALAKLGRVGQTAIQVAQWAGYGASELDSLRIDPAVQAKIREYTAELAAGAGWTIEDLRSIALSRLASVSMADLGDFWDYGGAREPVLSSAGSAGMSHEDFLVDEQGPEGAMRSESGDASDSQGLRADSERSEAKRTTAASEGVDLGLCPNSSDTTEGFVCGGVDLGLQVAEESSCGEKDGGGHPQEHDPKKILGTPAPRRAKNSSLPPNPGLRISPDNELRGKRRGTNDYFKLSDGTLVRMKQLDELPSHLGGAVKSLRFKTLGVEEDGDGHKYPIVVPEIELYDSLRATELLLKYNGDIGTNRKDTDIVGAIDIAEFLAAARARVNESNSSTKSSDVVEAEFAATGDDGDVPGA